MQNPALSTRLLERDINPPGSSRPDKGDFGRRENGSTSHLRLVDGDSDGGLDVQEHASTSYRTPAAISGAVVERAVSGEEAAFTEIVRWYHPRFVRFAQNMMQSANDADDAVQEAFIRIYKALPLYRECDRFESWLFRILANCCRTSLAKRKRMNLRQVSLDSSEALGIQARSDTRDDFGWSSMLTVALKALPVEQREAFLLHHVNGHSYETMAEMTGLGQSALKMRVKRACDRLKVMLSEVVDA